MKDEQYPWRPILAVSFFIQGFELIARGIDELHLEEICASICNDHGEVFDGKPKVILLETIRNAAESEGKYIRQAGGFYNYGHVKLRLEPRPEGSGFKFSNELSSNLLPEEYATAVEMGVREVAAAGGVLFGYELVDIQATLIGGTFHETDSNATAFQIAASIAFKEATRKASPILLEPMMAVEGNIPEGDFDKLVRDIAARRGRIDSVKLPGHSRGYRASIPLREALRFSPLGRPKYSMQFAGYEPIRHDPGNSDQDGPGVTADLPKSPHLRRRYAAAQPDIDLD